MQASAENPIDVFLGLLPRATSQGRCGQDGSAPTGIQIAYSALSESLDETSALDLVPSRGEVVLGFGHPV